MTTNRAAIALILAGILYLAWNSHRYAEPPEAKEMRQAAALAQSQRWQEVAAKVSALPGFSVPSGQSAGIMRIITTEQLSDYEARKLCQTVQDQLGEGNMVRLVEDTGHILATRY